MSRTWRLLLWPLLVVAAVGASFAYLDMDTAGLFSGKGLGQMAAYASEFFPPDLSAPHLRAIGRGLLETLAMSAIGTLLAHVRRGDIESVHSLRRGAAEAIEVVAHGDAKSSKVIGRSINEIKLPPGTTIGALVRDEEVLIAHGDTRIESGDHVLLFLVDKKYIRDVERLFQAGLTFF